MKGDEEIDVEVEMVEKYSDLDSQEEHILLETVSSFEVLCEGTRRGKRKRSRA